MDGENAWAKWGLVSILLKALVAVAIIVTALYDLSVGNMIGRSAARFGLFWLFGLTILFRIAVSIVFRKERKVFRAKEKL
jgi:hypothetical protein